jgi:ferredoxin--NADP+ reductase
LAYSEQTVQWVRSWSARTFSLAVSRPQGLAFRNGEFVTLGQRREGKLVAHAYSIVSTHDAEHLEFLSIHVPDGPLTSLLARVRPGDTVWVNDKPTGTLTLDHIRPGRVLHMLATGTGLAPFVSLVRDPETHRRFGQAVLVHSVRTQAELAYRDELAARADGRFHYVATVTREPFPTPERGADLFRSGELSRRLGLPGPDLREDRVMVCGNPAMTREMTRFPKEQGWTPANHKGVGNFTTELAFALREP